MAEDAPKAKCDAGAPAWVMTFADLMSLLMCFFVLLLSFSEMDVSKYKEMAGSLKDAFGVQRDIRIKEPPKGINVIAREFSPGRPEPTQLNVIRQMTTDDLRINLDLGKERHRPVPTPRADHEPDREKSSGTEDRDGKPRSQSEGLTSVQREELERAKALAAKRLEEKLRAEAQLESLQQQNRSERVDIDRKTLDKLLAARQAAEQQKKLNDSARLISAALGREIKAGSVDVETAGRKIIIRVREKASFGSGHTELKDGFRPLLGRVAKILKDSEGKIIVAGHTDNVPIYTERFRSNWELSAARAVSVAHAMMDEADIPSQRFLIQGFADTEPVAPNDTAANRARNRRVEIILQQGDDISTDRQISGESAAAATGLPAASAQRQTADAAAPADPGAAVKVPAAAGFSVRAGGIPQPAGRTATSANAKPAGSPATLGVRAVGR